MSVNSTSTALVVYSGNTSDITTSNNNNNNNKGEQRFVGLSNQGATCYMNSLLQTLFMTPEFRTALYKWKYNPEKDGNESECIPLQLQKLFGLLQISNTRSVDTIALTKSFGWEGSEVFQQQDVQELFRILFDALEGSFKGSELENAIDEIYGGEMIDYVKCIDIDYQSERRDKFLDCSLAIKPYGSNRIMKSLTECLEHYLEPEILDGPNKYFAESVGRKVDAIKGLKFSKLPQILAIHLKRFVFDFSGDSIIQMKINDEVTFPLLLDMNKYVSRCQKSNSEESKSNNQNHDENNENDNNEDDINKQNEQEEVIDEFEQFIQKKIIELRNKKNLEDSNNENNNNNENNQSNNNDNNNNNNNNNDWKSGTGSPVSTRNYDVQNYNHENYDVHLESKDDIDSNIPDLVDYNGNLHPDLVKNKDTTTNTITPIETPITNIEINSNSDINSNVNLEELIQQRGEWIYELYAVLVHSGAISGGHYYVYIKDVETNKWWNFNDSYVDEIKVEKVLQASGGLIQTTNYYGVKSQSLSSSNAYMLMYRKVSLTQLKTFPPDSMVPQYIHEEIKKLTEIAEKRRKDEEERYLRLPLQIHWNGKQNSIVTTRYALYKTLLQQIWTELKLYETPEYQEILKRNKEIELKQKENNNNNDNNNENNNNNNENNENEDITIVPLNEIRLRIYSSYNKMKQDPFVVETKANFALDTIRITTYRELAVELKSRYDEWEVYEADGFNLQLLEYDVEKDDFKPPVNIRLPRGSLLKDLKNKITQHPQTNHLDINTLRILKLAVWSFSDVKVDEVTSNDPYSDNLRLLLDLRICEGQKLYLESDSTLPINQSKCVECFTTQVNRLAVTVNRPGSSDNQADVTVYVDRRWNMKQFRQEVGNALGISPDSFRVFRKTSLDAELNGEHTQTLYSLGIYNGITLHLVEGKPLLPGHYLLKLFLFKPPYNPKLIDLKTISNDNNNNNNESNIENNNDSNENNNKDDKISLEILPATESTPPSVIEVTGSSYSDVYDITSNPNVIVAGDVAIVSDSNTEVVATPIIVDTTTEVSMNDIDIELLSNGTSTTTSTSTDTTIITKNNTNNKNDPFEINEDTPESSPDDIIGFGFKTIDLLPPNEQFEYIMDIDVEADTKISEMKQRIYDHFISIGKISSDITPNHLRLRLKSRNTVSTIFSSVLSLRQNQVNLFSGREISVEILDHEEYFSTLPYGDVIVYVQKWERSTWTLSKPIEVILHSNMSVSEISKRLSSIYNIPPNSLRVLLIQPYHEIKICDLHLTQPSGHRPWLSTSNENRPLSQMQWYLRDWDTLLIQNVDEKFKKLSKVEIQSVKDARAYQTSYGYDYYYDTSYVSTGTNTNTSSNTNNSTGISDVKKSSGRVEKGIYIKTQKEREKERQQNEKSDEPEVAEISTNAITLSFDGTYSLLNDIE